jgi:transcriptional regulator with XRE-family HTH domain
MELPIVAAPVEYDSFGALLRSQRQRAHLSQEELAARSGLSERTIRNLEANRVRVPRASTARLLAEALGQAGPEREAFVRACRGDPDPPERVETRSAPGAGPARLQGDLPAQLPMDVHGFAGREDQLARLDAILATAGEQPTTAVPSAISGTAGVGKTTVAVHWAHRVAGWFGDGQLYVNLRGFDPTGSAVSPAKALGGFLDALGVPPQRIPTGLDGRAALYRSLLAGRRMLVLLDNARDAEHVRPPLPGTPGCLVVVTSRNQLTGLVVGEGAQPLTLDLLSDDEARELLVRRLGTERVAAEPQAVGEIIARCARLPLALAIVAARAAIHADISLTVLAEELRRAGESLDAFAGDHTAADVRAVFFWSCRALSVEAARLFRLLGLHPGPDLSAPAAASMARSAAGPVRRCLAELTWAHLVTEHLPDRHTFHDLLRTYAVELAHTVDSEPNRRAATQQLLDHYRDAPTRAALLREPRWDRTVLPRPRHDLTGEDLTDRARSLAWFTAELPVLLAIIERGAAGFDTHIWQLAWALTDFLPRRGLWQDWAATQRAALDAAQRLGDRAGMHHDRTMHQTPWHAPLSTDATNLAGFMSELLRTAEAAGLLPGFLPGRAGSGGDNVRADRGARGSR